MANEKIYADGLVGKSRETKFGTIIALSFKAEDFISFLQDNANDAGWVNVDLLERRDGNGYYGVLDTFTPKSKSGEESQSVKGGDLF